MDVRTPNSPPKPGQEANLPKSVSAYSYATLAWFATQGIPLIVWPSFISSLLGEEYHQSNGEGVPR